MGCVLTKNAANQHEVLEENLYISEDGYLETFVINETPEDVWFDNFMVMSTTSPVMQETHYGPWGLELTGIGFQYTGIKANKYLYNGKELIEDNGLQYYDYGARMYDPVIGRWGVVDPLAHERSWVSTYNFVQNKPILRVDPDGRKDIIYDHEGNQTGLENDNWFHNFFLGERNYITDKGGDNRFRLGEQGLAVMKSENFEGFESTWESSTGEKGLNARIIAATENYNPMEENVVNYALRESKDGGEMDQKLQLNPNKIYGFASNALNRNEAGNVVWGAAMNVLGMDPFGTYAAAHGGTLLLRGRLDERDESSAAMMGSFYMQNSQSGRQLYKTLYKQIYSEWLQKNYGLTPR